MLLEKDKIGCKDKNVVALIMNIYFINITKTLNLKSSKKFNVPQLCQFIPIQACKIMLVEKNKIVHKDKNVVALVMNIYFTNTTKTLKKVIKKF